MSPPFLGAPAVLDMFQGPKKGRYISSSPLFGLSWALSGEELPIWIICKKRHAVPSLLQQAGPPRWSRLIAKTMIQRYCLQVLKLGAIHIFYHFDCPLNLLHPYFTVVNRYTIYEVCCEWHQDKLEKEKINASPKNEDESKKKGKGRWVGLSSGSLLRANQSQTSALPQEPAKPRVPGGSFLFIFHTIPANFEMIFPFAGWQYRWWPRSWWFPWVTRPLLRLASVNCP